MLQSKACYISHYKLDYLCTVDTCSLYFSNRRKICATYSSKDADDNICPWEDDGPPSTRHLSKESPKANKVNQSIIHFDDLGKYHLFTIDHELLVGLKI